MNKERARRRKITEYRVRAIVIILLMCFVLTGRYVYAKYYSQGARAGIAIASGIYFSANYAVASEEDGEYFESIVTSEYMGNSYNFDFEVRNYENNLLFNESSVSIPYSVSFKLGKVPSGATYSVSWGENKETLSATDEVTIEQQSIAGGSTISNKYTIQIETQTEPHTAVPIYVEVRTQEGALIEKLLRGKMVLSSDGRPENFIESQEFIVATDIVDETEKFAQIEKLSELTYEVRTVGEVLVTDEVTEELKLAWNPEVLEIDLFDEVYQKWLSDNNRTEPFDDTENVGWKYITIKVMPYSVENIDFFRGTKYGTLVTDISSLESYIEAKEYRQTSG